MHFAHIHRKLLNRRYMVLFCIQNFSRVLLPNSFNYHLAVIDPSCFMPAHHMHWAIQHIQTVYYFCQANEHKILEILKKKAVIVPWRVKWLTPKNHFNCISRKKTSKLKVFNWNQIIFKTWSCKQNRLPWQPNWCYKKTCIVASCIVYVACIKMYHSLALSIQHL